MRVLICDDDASLRFSARRILERRFGAVVEECANGAEALQALAERRFAFMLLDVDMPGLSGHDTLKAIRAAEATADLPVIIVSSESGGDAIVSLVQLGISDYVLKPLLPPAIFLSKVERLVAAGIEPLQQVWKASRSPLVIS